MSGQHDQLGRTRGVWTPMHEVQIYLELGWRLAGHDDDDGRVLLLPPADTGEEAA